MDINGYNIFHRFIDSRFDHLGDPLSDAADILRFLVRCYPQGIAAPDFQGKTPYSMLYQYSYARRLLLMSTARRDPTIDFHKAALRILNYEARKAALFAFFDSTNVWNILTRIRCASDGALMRFIVRFL